MPFYPQAMTELDQVWSQMLENAAAKAAGSGRDDIVAYLRLKATNDAIRMTGVNWLYDSLIEIAAEETRRGQAIRIERQEPHTHRRGNSNMVGSLLSFHLGVRCLTVETGWTRTPSDGVMTGGALASARILHFGISNANADLSFAYQKDLPIWRLDEDGRGKRQFYVSDLKDHFKVFLGK